MALVRYAIGTALVLGEVSPQYCLGCPEEILRAPIMIACCFDLEPHRMDRGHRCILMVVANHRDEERSFFAYGRVGSQLSAL